MGSWPKRCGWEPGPRRGGEGGLGCICMGGISGPRQERQGQTCFHPTAPALTYRCPGIRNRGPHCLDQSGELLRVHGGGPWKCLEGRLAPLAPGQQKDKLVFWSRALYCCATREGCRPPLGTGPQQKSRSHQSAHTNPTSTHNTKHASPSCSRGTCGQPEAGKTPFLGASVCGDTHSTSKETASLERDIASLSSWGHRPGGGGPTGKSRLLSLT